MTMTLALQNARALFSSDGIEPPTRTPSTVVYHDGPHRLLRRYAPSAAASGNPVLLVPPLAVDTSCYDLRPRQSLARFLVDSGRQPYVLDYGDITYADRNLGFEEWIDDIVPTAIARVSAEHGGAPVDVVAWSLGGTISLLTAASHADLPLASVTALGTPINYHRYPGFGPLMALGRFTGGNEIALPTKLFGGIPAVAVQAGFRGVALQRELTKPLFVARNLHRTESLARMEAVDRFIDAMPGYPGRLYRQVYRQLMIRNGLAKGTVHLSPGRVVELAKVTCRVLLVGSKTDTIAPAPAVAYGTKVLHSAAELRYEEVTGVSHLGLVADPDAITWPIIEDFLRG